MRFKVRETVGYILVLVGLLHHHDAAEYKVTIHPKFLAQNGRVHYETDRWDGHNGLDVPQYIDKCKQIGTESGRWLNRDLNGNIFQNTPEDPHHHGYPDPRYFMDDTFVQDICVKYKSNLQGYGNNSDLIMEIKGLYWPNWMNTSLHGGKFPNNLDAGAEFIVLLLKSIKQCTGGIIPRYFEVMNEPDAAWKYISWNTVIEFHKIVAKKLKTYFPGIKVGGPTKTGAISVSDQNNFRVWGFSRQFLDMSLDHLDFFSFHPYNYFIVEGNSYRFEGSNEARLVASIDMIESYAYKKKGQPVPLIISEYGLSQIRGIDENKQSAFIDWAYVNQHNAHMFTYLNYRAFIDRAVGFLLSYESYLGQASLHHSLFYQNGSLAHAAKAYQFWHHVNYNFKFLRIQGEMNNQERKISPLAMVNPVQEKIAILLHNYDKFQATIRLDFHNNWFTPTSGISHCQYLNSNREPVLAKWVPFHVNNGHVSVPGDASCNFVFDSKYDFRGMGTLHETTYYGLEMVIPIAKNCGICIFTCLSCSFGIKTRVNIHAKGIINTARLRLGISLPGNTGGSTTPKTVLINGHAMTSYYQLYAPGRGHEGSRWEVYEYEVMPNILHSNLNEVKVEFNQASGYVSTVALVVDQE